MHSILFYIVPILIYTAVNLSVDLLKWPHLLVLLLAFLMFQLVRLRYSKDSMPLYAKVTQWTFYVLTIAFLFRDKYQYLNPLVINLLLVATIALVLFEIARNKEKPKI